jgi:DNA-binding NarL/FixJ family response regulator
MKIVLFDDQLLILDALKRSFHMLLHQDVMITSFTQSKPLLTHLENCVANIVVLDLITPEDLGFAIIEQTISMNPHALIVVYSNVSTDFIIEMVKSIGIDLYIHKSTPALQTAELILQAVNTKYPAGASL